MPPREEDGMIRCDFRIGSSNTYELSADEY